MTKPWIGVDLDGTLARDVEDHATQIGPPVPIMLERVKRWLADGKTVKIFTARAAHLKWYKTHNQQSLIDRWCLEHVGRILQITATKDFYMVRLWDDRAIGVVKDSGVTHVEDALS